MSLLAVPFYLAGKALSAVLAVVPPYATLFCVNMSNAPNFWWYFMHRFGYSAETIFPPALVLLSRGLFLGVKLL
jgi:hypothetical protein